MEIGIYVSTNTVNILDVFIKYHKTLALVLGMMLFFFAALMLPVKIHKKNSRGYIG